MTFVFAPDLRDRVRANLSGLQPRLLRVEGARHAAVGVVLLPDASGAACFVLTRRPTTLRRHRGQWALPGGRLEPGETTAAAALREIQEEIGLALPESAILGRLDDFLSRSGHLISPVVVWAADAMDLLVSPEEVDAAYLVPLSDLDDPASVRFEPLLHFALLGSTVFAPTAAIIYQFREAALHGRDVHLGDVEQPLFAWS